MSELYWDDVIKQTALPSSSVKNTLSLLSEGATIPFIARYRKEKTGSLDEVAIALIQKTLKKIEELEDRKKTILKSIEEQGKLTPELQKKIEQCKVSTELEDLYLPYKKKKKTKADMAREAGLEPLAKLIMVQSGRNIQKEASRFLNDVIQTEDDAIHGASDIIAEWINEDQFLREKFRDKCRKFGLITSKVVTSKKEQALQFKDYFEFSEPLYKCPSHRFLALARGQQEGFLRVAIEMDEERSIEMILRKYVRSSGEEATIIELSAKDAWKRLLSPSIEGQVWQEFKEKADDDAIEVFSKNLEQLLLSPPLGEKNVMAIDPGFRTGCKVVCLNRQGTLLQNEVIYPHPPQNQVQNAAFLIRQLVEQHRIEAVAIGDGTAARETESFVKSMKLPDHINIYMVNESGASIYSASEIAREEFPNHDITVRGAVSIGRRLLDPLAELIKIDPKSIGVGQYQHDVHQSKLKDKLDLTVESCVNRVGINLNTASKPLLTYVSGLGPTLAKNIIEYRNEYGEFTETKQLLSIPRLGEKAFEQCAGFLRIRGGKHPLDNTGVHPESYPIVEKMAKDLNVTVVQLMKDKMLRMSIKPEMYVTDKVGLPTLKDILKELEKPGLDPRGEAKLFAFDPNIKEINDVKAGMIVPGIVTNITNFGAFVSIGVKQDGMVHISQISTRFISSPAEVLTLRQEVMVKVLDVDIQRNRINLSMLV
ncbi:MAG: Tex family protein [Saprospiraceae bacterium]